MAKKKTTKRKVTKKKTTRKKPAPRIDKEPEFMVHVSEPKMLRKDLLESLREIIIFMQGYEKFRRIQEEKVSLLSSLKDDVKSINYLLNNKLRKHLPKGKLRAVGPKPPQPVMPTVEEVDIKEPIKPVADVPKPAPPPVEPEPPKNDLDELENQLKDIEEQLQKVN